MAYETSDTDAGRVRAEVRRFKENILLYIAVLAVLVLANIVVGGFWYAHFWLFWIALVWGVFIVFQGVRLFGDDIGRDWEDRMVSHVMARRRGEPPRSSPRQPGSAPPRAQPSPPARPPTPAWPPSSASRSAQAGPIVIPPPVPETPAEEPLVTPPPGHDPLLEPPGGPGV